MIFQISRGLGEISVQLSHAENVQKTSQISCAYGLRQKLLLTFT